MHLLLFWSVNELFNYFPFYMGIRYRNQIIKRIIENLTIEINKLKEHWATHERFLHLNFAD